MNGTRYTARYTLADGTRAYIPEPVDTWDQAFREACDLQDAVERGTYRSETAMTFAQLAHDHFLPRYSSGTNLATTTYRTVDSHFGDGTGQPRRKGRKNELGARFALLYVFGRYWLNEINPAMISRWQDEMLAEGYLHSTVLAKRSVLKNCLELARVNGWLKGVNPVEAVAVPIKRERQDEDRAITPQEWGLIRAQLSGEGTTLLFDITLDTGLRFQEITGLRPMDVFDAADKDPAHLHLRHVIAWPGRKYNKVTPGHPWHAKEPKGRRFRGRAGRAATRWSPNDIPCSVIPVWVVSLRPRIRHGRSQRADAGRAAAGRRDSRGRDGDDLAELQGRRGPAVDARFPQQTQRRNGAATVISDESRAGPGLTRSGGAALLHRMASGGRRRSDANRLTPHLGQGRDPLGKGAAPTGKDRSDAYGRRTPHEPRRPWTVHE